MPPASDPKAAAASPALPDETFRLHPLTPIALGGRVLGILIVITALGFAERGTSGGGSPNWIQVAIFGGLAVLVVVRGIVTVAVTSYHLLGGELRIDSGLLQKQSKRIRLDRVQSVDVAEPLSARIFGLAEVRVTTAGSERAAVRLRYVTLPVAQSLRADLLGRSTGAGEGTVEAPERPLITVPHGRLVGSVLLQMVSWRLLLLAVGPALTVIGQQNGHKATTGIGIAILVWFAVLIAHAIWQRVNSLWEFTVTESPDGLRVRHGLLSTTRQTVPPGKVQAILIHQPMSWRPFGWVQVRMNVAGYGRADSSKRTTLIPVTDRAFAESLVGWMLGGVDLHDIPLTRPPRRAALRAPLWWRAEWAGADDRVFVARHGLLSRTIDVVPHERTQSLRLTAGPWQRALGLASFHLDSTPGPVRTRAAHRDAAEARQMLDHQIDRARTARQTGGRRPAPAPQVS
ncbi:MAG TPA: PH domain-containing protein [Acidimicrobiales bacterium]|nr:PH domain-containing protein [Acidimicrobiales bacterium]